MANHYNFGSSGLGDFATQMFTKIQTLLANYTSGVKGAAESNYRHGNVNITAANIGTYTSAQIDDKVQEAAGTVVVPEFYLDPDTGILYVEDNDSENSGS